MKERIIRIKKQTPIILFLFAFSSPFLMAQTIKLMPMGDSITMGKYNGTVPGNGYREPLYDLVHVAHNVDFVGPDGTNPYFGYFRDGARIDQFLPDSGGTKSPYDVKIMLDALPLANRPNLVLLHIGTNDMSSEQVVGSHTQQGSILYELNVLLNALLDYNTGGHSIDQIFLCKIIPVVPYKDYPGINAKILDFNSRIDLLYNDLSASKKNRVTIVNMHASFYANQTTYYNTDVDHFHPNYAKGYPEMANIFFSYLNDYFAPWIIDQFAYGSDGASLNGYNGWTAQSAVRIDNVGESGGGAIYSNATGTSWNNGAIWNQTRGLNSVSFRYHPTSSSNADTLSWAGVLIGMDTTVTNPSNPDAAQGYMVHVRGGRIRVWTVVTGQVQTEVANKVFPSIVPGDSIRITFTIGTTENRFYIELNGEDEGSLAHATTDPAFKVQNSYAGVIFRGSSGNPNAGQAAVLIDFLQAETRRKDIIAPAPITELSAIAVSNTTVTLQWRAVGGDGLEGKAASYDLRYSHQMINNDNFENASIVTTVPIPGNSGTIETATVKGLLSGARYYFVVKAVDNWGNKGNLVTYTTAVTEKAGEIVDNFDRATLGEDWSYDPNEYQIGANNEVVNTSATVGWGTPVIYQGRSNPTTVKMVWGQNVQNPGPGEAENGGLVLLADDSTNTANGYLLFVRTQLRKIYLFEIRNGIIQDTVLHAVAYDYDKVGRYPGAGDTLTVVVDWSETAFNRFDVYVNHIPASRFALYDITKKYGHANKNYSGFLLYRTTRNNNVAAFITSGEKASAGNIAIYGTYASQDTVNTLLSDSLRVVVWDENNVILNHAPVFFSVTQGGGSISAPVPPQDRMYIEAEWYRAIKTPMVEADDPLASGGKYIYSTERTPDNDGYAEYKFYIDTPGTYYFWARTKWAGNYFERDFRFELRDARNNYLTPVGGFTWHVQELEGSSLGKWKWDKVTNNGIRYSAVLIRGMYTLRVYTQHRYVPLDKFLLTRDSNPGLVISDSEPVGAVYTNSAGMASTACTLGRAADDKSTPGVNEGLNTVVARPFGTDASVQFNITGVPAAPVAFTKSNDNQSGAAGRQLAKPFIISLLDSYGNKPPNVSVTFQVLGGKDGHLTASIVPTDSVGKASVYLVLGYQDTLYQVQASVAGITDVAIFTAKVDSGFVSQMQVLPGDGAGQKHYVNQTIPNFLKVKLLDDKGKPISNCPVTFAVVEAQGLVQASTGKQPKLTNVNGIATDTLKMGSNAGIVKVVARTTLITDTVVVDSVFYWGTRVAYLSGSGYTRLGLGETTPAPQTVVVLRKDGGKAANHPVTFTISDPASGFRFSDGSTVVNTITNVDGKASTYTKAGNIHGLYPNIVQAWSTDGFRTIPDSPVNFSFGVKSDASYILKVEGDGLEGVIGNVVGPLKVRMMNRDQTQAIPSQPVIFKRRKGNGYFGGDVPVNYFTEMTDANGYAAAYYYLGSEAGPDKNEVVAYTKNGSDSLSTLFTLVAKSSNADSMAAYQMNTSFSYVVGKDTTIRVAIMDNAGNKVGNAQVVFTVTKGGGVLNGAAETVSVYTDSIGVNKGIASIVWTLGTHAGNQNNVLKVESSNGVGQLKGGPLYFTVSTIPDNVNPSTSEISATGPIRASGQDTSFVTVTLYDQYKNPIPGKRVHITVVDGTMTHPFDPKDPTDASGKAVGGFVTYAAGEKKVHATVVEGNLLLDAEAKVIVQATDPAKIRKSDPKLGEPESGDMQTGNVGTVLKKPLVVRVTDISGNGVVAFKAVTFDVDPGDKGTVLEPKTVQSDSNGYARAYLVLDPQVGQNRVKVTADELEGGPLYFSATGKIGVPVSLYRVSPQSQTAVAGEQMPTPLQVGVKDVDGNSVAGSEITFKVNDGGLVSPSSDRTDEYGIASTFFTASTLVGGPPNLVTATSTTIGSAVNFLITTVAGPGRKIEHVSGNGEWGYVGQNSPITLTVKVVDRYGNPVNGESVEFKVISGDAAIDTRPMKTVLSNTLGRASVVVTLGDIAGPIIVHAINRFLEGSPVVFTLEARTVLATGIVKLDGWYSGDNQKGTVGKPFVDPLRVKVVDDYSNPVFHEPVYFIVVDGGGNRGHILEDPPVYSDTNGIAQIHFMGGSSTGKTTVRAVGPNGSEVDFSLETVVDPNSPRLKTGTELYQEVWEGSNLFFSLTAEDDDPNDRLSFQAYLTGGFNLPDGARLHTEEQAENTAVFLWTTNYDQQGTYSIVLRVTDGMGGFDADTMAVRVLNRNRLPKIISKIPTKKDTTVTAGHTVTFLVDAIDLDGDPLTYSWQVDGKPVGTNASVYRHTINKSFVGNQQVKVIVADNQGYDNDGVYLWNLNVKVSVALAEFAALFDENNRFVQLRWSTSQEWTNVGFDVFRSEAMEGEYVKINEEFIPSQTSGQYSYVDRTVEMGRIYYYKILDLDIQGNRREHGPVMVKVPLPQKFILSQNYPNPFNPVTTFQYQVPRKEHITLTIFNIMGQRVITLVDETKDPGYYSVEWDGKDAFGNDTATGIYIYRLQGAREALTRRMVKMK